MSEPKVIQATRYVCTGCHRSWARRASAKAHMERCWRIPENRACLTCAHFDSGRCCDTASAECGCRGETDWTCAVGGPISDGLAVLHCPLWMSPAFLAEVVS